MKPAFPKAGHLPFLDIIRGIAILAVYGFHAYGAAFQKIRSPWRGWVPDTAGETLLALASYPLTYGRYGVAVFFAVSGFCIHLSHRRSSEQSWSSFAARRFFRLYPTYVAAALLFYCMPLLLSFVTKARMDGAWQLVSHLLLIHNVTPDTFMGLNPSFWSLAIEAQLYVVYPLLLGLAARTGWATTLAVAGATELGIRGLAASDAVRGTHDIPFGVTESPFAYWGSWAIGAYLAEQFLDGRPTFLGRLPLGALLPLCLVFPVVKPLVVFAFPLFAVTTAVIMDRCLRGEWKMPQTGLCARACQHLSFVGLVSYSLYLIHQPFLNLVAAAVRRFLPGSDVPQAASLAACAGAYPLLLGTAYFSYKVLEEPSTRLGKAVLAGMRRAAA